MALLRISSFLQTFSLYANVVNEAVLVVSAFLEIFGYSYKNSSHPSHNEFPLWNSRSSFKGTNYSDLMYEYLCPEEFSVQKHVFCI